MGYSESQSANLIFDSLSKIAKSRNQGLRLIRIVIFENEKFVKFRDATKAYVPAGAANAGPQPSKASLKSSFRVFRAKKSFKPSTGDGLTFKIYSNDNGKLDNAWKEFKRKITENIQEKTMHDDVIKKFTDQDLAVLRKMEGELDAKIIVKKDKGKVEIKCHSTDISKIQDEVHKLVKKISENQANVPKYWDSTLSAGVFQKVNLPSSGKEYKDVETAFRKTAPNRIVRIERIQNEEIYRLYNVKRQAMMKKYGDKFAGKELMLFHGTSSVNIEKINSGGLNRSFAGMHATALGRGVYFARDAIYSCQQTYSPPDAQGNRYMYYAKVLVGDYIRGSSSMIVAPNKPSNDPNETYDSVVDNVSNPSMYVLFQDYEYYTEYLITFV